MPGKKLPTAPVTIYRFPAGLPLTDYLKPPKDAELEVDQTTRIAGATAHLVAGGRVGNNASWGDHPRQITGVDLELAVRSPFLVVVVELDQDWVCAATWGVGAHHLLDETLLDEGFGLAFAVRRVDPSNLRTVNSASVDTTSRQTRTSFPLGNPLSAFPLEPAGEVVTHVTGPADMAGLTYHRATGKTWQIKAGDSLHIQLGRSPEDFVADLRTICAVVDSTDAASPLRFINQVRPAGANHPLMAELEARLAVALGGDTRFGPIGLCWPNAAAAAAAEANSFAITSFGGLGHVRLDPDVDIDEVTARFAQITEGARLAELKTARLAPCADDQGEDALVRPITLDKWISFETTLGSKTFCLNRGRWYEIGEDAVARVHERLAELFANTSPLPFPTWRRASSPDDEHRYCELVAEQSGFLCLDKNLARTPMHPRLELADLLGPDNELIHVKWPSGAAAMGHLFTQTRASAWSLRSEPEALGQLDTKVRMADNARTITTRPRTVVLAIGGRQWGVQTLFTLTQVGLIRLSQELSYLGMTLQFANIPFVAKSRKNGRSSQAA
ncbi:uncharacterized protein (TIGR04141 family) [Actinokineospora baliensis]|uniref:TIGR04141 family sporadically distributed protein n=1 Tax=Actinokineospora baliensis TaxID=547056 RepID=UPI00195686F8|nr:TIGR04141 family sporadically distributed protein [Actinokineospora baliensis]MBM7772632.1 uncharacterized protein (TIGR04141 family) [Actinokineospora baliensis]